MTERPDVLLLVGGGHNYRHLGARGGPVETPTLDGLLEGGTAFERAYTPAPAPTPGRVGLLTGRRAASTGVCGEGDPLPADVETLPRWLGRAGYDTCLVGSLGVTGDRQFAGFDHRPYGDLTTKAGVQFDPPTNPKARGSPFESKTDGVGGAHGHRYDPIDPDRRAPDPWRGLTADAGETGVPESARQDRAIVSEAVDWLREHDATSESPWLLTASFPRPSPPLTAPARHVERYRPGDLPEVGADDAPAHPVADAKRERDEVQSHTVAEAADLDDAQVRRSRAAYRASVSYLDEVIGDLLATVEREGLLEDTVVVYAGAAGTLLGEHGLWWDGAWHEGATRVPLVVETPAHRDGTRERATIETPVSLLDLAPTLCGLAGVAAPADLDGTALADAVATGAEPDRGPVVSEFLARRYGDGTEFRVAVDGDDKHVAFRDAPDLRYDLSADPAETSPRTGASEGTPADAVDFAAAADRRERVAATAGDLVGGRGTSGNAHLLPDGRLLDADLALYKPDVLAETASRLFADWPDGRE
jgi:choline-sulfatase